MTTDALSTLINGSEYDFLKTNDHLKDKIIFLTLGGSHSYGTNVDGSDIDLRGCALNSRSDLLGLSNFEQVVNEATDTTVYSFNKLISLLVNCNPNTIEMLGCKPEHYVIMTDIGKEMIDNRKLFLSRRAASSFGGYANQQLRRLENSLARHTMPQEMKEEHILRSMQGAICSFKDRYESIPSGGLKLFTDESNKSGFEHEIYADINLTHYPVRDFCGMINELTSITSQYDKLNHRNHKKDDYHLNKHAMHLVRLYLMCFDILENEEVITYREKDHELLMSIRSGYYQSDDGTFRSEFFEMIDSFERRLAYDRENTSLPSHPNFRMVEDFVMSVNQRSLS